MKYNSNLIHQAMLKFSRCLFLCVVVSKVAGCKRRKSSLSYDSHDDSDAESQSSDDGWLFLAVIFMYCLFQFIGKETGMRCTWPRNFAIS